MKFKCLSTQEHIHTEEREKQSERRLEINFLYDGIFTRHCEMKTSPLSKVDIVYMPIGTSVKLNFFNVLCMKHRDI